MPTSMEKINDERTIRFRNHQGDRTPSTIARGTFSTLLLCGSSAPSGTFRLPGNLTAQELGDHLAHRFGLMTPAITLAVCVTAESDRPPFQLLKSRSGMSLIKAHE